MTSSSDGRRRGLGILNVPPPDGSKAGLSYTRFIPREELGDVQPWEPGSFGGAGIRPRQAEQGPAAPTEQEWLARLETARQRAYEDGYRDGVAALESFKKTHTALVSAQVGQLVQSFDNQWAQLEHQMADSLSRSAVLLAQQVLRSELRTDPSRVRAVAAEALNAVMMGARQVLVRVHPDDLPLVAEGAGEALQARGARLQADPHVQRGGCSVESDAGTIDATIETRWARAAQAMGHVLDWKPAELAREQDAHPMQPPPSQGTRTAGGEA